MFAAYCRDKVPKLVVWLDLISNILLKAYPLTMFPCVHPLLNEDAPDILFLSQPSTTIRYFPGANSVVVLTK